MNDTKKREVKPVNKRHNEIRAVLRANKTTTLKELSQKLNVSESHAHKLMGQLIKKRHARVAYTEQTASGGKPRAVYALTDQYVTNLRKANEHFHAKKTVEHQTAAPNQKPSMYRRIIDWLTGGPDPESIR